ncbi:unnamed protein product [Spirodela intermedia]|uniref:Secreted protein n=1 Tax=Spirodela intermedia TaxID=51605 RepID=A0ABN7EEE0_SPIIN|nr:unnamed protein product [Spirodela intermedia]
MKRKVSLKAGKQNPGVATAMLLSLVCTTTPCPTAGWPPVTWKGSGAHVPLSVQAAQALTRGYSPTELPTRLKTVK